MVNYFLKNGGYSLRRGNAVWKKMEEEWICPGRTWQSLIERFGKNIKKSLKQFEVSKPQLEEVDRNMEGRGGKKARGFRQNANYYSREEDLKILKFIAEKKRFDDVAKQSYRLVSTAYFNISGNILRPKSFLLVLNPQI